MCVWERSNLERSKLVDFLDNDCQFKPIVCVR